MPRRWFFVLGGLGLLVAAVWWFTRAAPAGPGETIDFAPVPSPVFQKAQSPRTYDFPADHGPHLGFQTEWWYYTGNLATADGRHFGYQLTFFRRGLKPGEVQRTQSMASNDIYFAHFAISDVQAGTHAFDERFSRSADGLAGAAGDPYHVWLEDWSVDSLNAIGSDVHLQASARGQAIDLTLTADTPVVENGDRGLSAKGEQPGNASYYLSIPRLATKGTIRVGGGTIDVSGLSWFDHEWSTSALGLHDVGWDWFSLQLSDGRDLMFYQIRRQDGSISPVSSGTLTRPDGSYVSLDHQQVTVTVESRWTSPESGADYPARWRIQVPSQGIDLEVKPWLADQEMRVSIIYWEGAVHFQGTSEGQPADGDGYVELTGYKGSLQGKF